MSVAQQAIRRRKASIVKRLGGEPYRIRRLYRATSSISTFGVISKTARKSGAK